MLFLTWLTCVAAWSIKNGRVAVGGKDTAQEREPFASVGTLNLHEGRSLEIAFDVVADSGVVTKPHQVFVRLADANSSKTYIAKLKGKSAKLTIPHKLVPADLLGKDLEAHILVASTEGEPYQGKAFAVKPEGTPFKTVPKNAVKPEILHQFKVPPKHVSSIISLVFVAGVFILFMSLLAAWKKDVGLHFGAPFFLASVVAVEAVFLGYFVNLSIFTALLYVAILAPVVFVTGRYLV